MPPGREVTSLIFDLDGTLTDPREGITRCFAHAMTRMGLAPPPLKELEKYIGPPARDVFRELLATDDAARIEEGIVRYRERYAEVGLYENFAYEGIHEALSKLAEQRYRLWVCTSKPWVYAKPILARFGLSGFFAGVYGCELDGTFSDKAELLNHLLVREKLNAGECVMIGDRKHDARAARVNGARSLGVLYGFGDEVELRDAGVDALCLRPIELPSVIQGLSRRKGAQ